MRKTVLTLAATLITALGCHDDKPHGYGEDRPPVDQISSADRGLQSKDVVASSDQMAMDLLALPELQASDHRWLIVVDHVENQTSWRRDDLDIFLRRLNTNLATHGHGKVQLVENRDKLHALQSRELEQTGNGDPYGQGGGGKNAPGPAGIQPDFALYGRISEMPNRAHSYYYCEFTLTDLHNRTQVWTNAYEVKTRN